jgi:biopolymer transport protein TolR
LLRPRTKPSKLIASINMSGFLSILIVLFYLVQVSELTPRCDLCRIAADLPHVSHPTTLRYATREDAMTVTIERDGSVFFGYDRVLGKELPNKVRQGLEGGAEKKVYIRADARAKYGTIKQTLDGIRDAGIENIAFFADQRQTTPSSPAR